MQRGYSNKVFKYENKLYKLNQKGGNGDDTIHVYNGGSFSPPTIAHEKICCDTILFLQKHFRTNDTIKKIVMHVVPVSDIYPKDTVKAKCIPFDARFHMLTIMVDKVRKNINSNYEGKEYIIDINIDPIEQEITKSQGFIGTYKYVSLFAQKYSINPSNIFLLYGLDNVKGIITTGPKRWKNPIHLVSKFKILVYPRSGSNINYKEFADLFADNINSFDPSTQTEENLTTNASGLDDIKSEINIFYDKENPLQIQFMKEHFLEVSGIPVGEKDIISIADASASKIRAVLYNYDGFTLRQKIICESLDGLDPDILAFIEDNKLYKNGANCEGTTYDTLSASMSEKRIM